MSSDVEVVKWYTRARKFPQLIGRTPDGARLWGGPYTITQVVGGGLLLFVGVQTMSWWARYGLIGNALLLLGVAYGVVLLLGRIPVGSRNPLAVLGGLAAAVSAPRAGHHAGRPVRVRRPHQVRHCIVVVQNPGHAVMSAGASLAADAPPPAPATAAQPAAARRLGAPAVRAFGRGTALRVVTDRVHRRRESAPTPTPSPAPAPAVRVSGAGQPPALSAVQQLLARAATPLAMSPTADEGARPGSVRLEED